MTQETRQAATRESHELITRFSPAKNVECVVRTQGYADVMTFLASPADLIGEAYGWEPAESVRERLNLSHENGALAWHMRPIPRARDQGYSHRYALKVHISGESRGAEMSYTLVCHSQSPMWARELPGHKFVVDARPGGYEIKAWSEQPYVE